MLTVIWSTPRTGSTWYSHNLYNQVKVDNPYCIFLRQYLNKFNLDTYNKHGIKDFVKPFEQGCFFTDYYIDNFSKKILFKPVSHERVRNLHEEEAYRIGLLEKANIQKFPIIIHQHVSPMSIDAYYYLKNKADKNIYLYRENMVDQLASYVVAVYTQKFRRDIHSKITTVTDAEISKQQLIELCERIKYWHKLDKTDCEVIKFEDIPFNDAGQLQKQHSVKPINQVSNNMRDLIFDLDSKFQEFLLTINPTQKKNFLP